MPVHISTKSKFHQIAILYLDPLFMLRGCPRGPKKPISRALGKWKDTDSLITQAMFHASLLCSPNQTSVVPSIYALSFRSEWPPLTTRPCNMYQRAIVARQFLTDMPKELALRR